MRRAAHCLAWAAALCAFAAKPTPRPKPVTKALSGEITTLLQKGLALLQKGDLASARVTLEQVRQVQPDNADAALNLGIIAYREKRLSDAEKLLLDAVHHAPENAQAWLILGVVRQDEGRLDGSLAALAQAVFFDPKNARAHHYLGVTIGRKGWYSGAEDELRKAIELQPDYAEAHFNLAVFYLQRTPPAVELARRHYQKALDLGAAPDPQVAKAIGE